MMNYSGVADLAIYPSTSRNDLLDERRGVQLPDGAYAHLSRAIVRTTFEGPDPTVPSRLEILTKARAYSYMNPKLVNVRGPQTLIKALVPRASGVLCGLEEVFIVIMSADTFGYPRNDHPKLTEQNV